MAKLKLNKMSKQKSKKCAEGAKPKKPAADSWCSTMSHLNDDISLAGDEQLDESDAPTFDCIDNMQIYSFSSMKQLKSYARLNELKIALPSEAKSSPPPPPSQSGDYLKKLGDNLISKSCASASKKNDDMLWQPNIKLCLNVNSNDSSPARCGGRSQCKLGCICDVMSQWDESSAHNESMSSDGKHCGRHECMFVCSCSRRLRSSSVTPQKAQAEQRKQPISNKSLNENRRTSSRINKATKVIDKTPNKKIEIKLKKTNAKSSAKATSKKSNKSNHQSRQRQRRFSSCSTLSSSKNRSHGSLESINQETMDDTAPQEDTNDFLNTCSSNDEQESRSNATESTTEPRKSERVKSLISSQKTSTSNDFYYYSTNKSLKQKHSLVAKDESSPAKKQAIDLASSNSKKENKNTNSNKPAQSAALIKPKPASAIFQNVNANSQLNKDEATSGFMAAKRVQPFKSYIKYISLKIIKNKSDQMSSGSFDTSSSASSASSTASPPIFTNSVCKMPLALHVLTKQWETSADLRMRVLRRVAKLLQSPAKWIDNEFEIDNLLIRVANARPAAALLASNQTVAVRVFILNKVKKAEQVPSPISANVIDVERQKNILSLNDLVKSSIKIRSKLINNSETEELSKESRSGFVIKNTLNTSLVEEEDKSMQSLNKNQVKPSTFIGNKSLPRLLCRNRSNKQLEANKTAIVLKQFDSLFASKLVAADKFDQISTSLVHCRPDRIPGSLMSCQISGRFYRDEIEYCNRRGIVDAPYPFYNPFCDSELILGLYGAHQSRSLVDQVGESVNELVNKVCSSIEQNNRLPPTANDSIEIINLADSDDSLQELNKSSQSKNFQDFQSANVVAVSPVQLTKIKAQQSNGQIRSFINSFPLNANQKITNLTAIKPPVKNTDEQKVSFNSHSILNKSYSFNPINCIKTNPSTNNNSKSNILIVNPKLNSLSTFQLNKSTDDISGQENTMTSRPTAPLIKPVITATTSANRNNMVISKTIIPSSFGALRYKTLVKIITPETNNPDGNKKIKISSSCLMPAYTCMSNAIQPAKHVPFMPVIKSNENPIEKSTLHKVVDSPKLLTKLITTTQPGQQKSYICPPKLVPTPQFNSSPNQKKVVMASNSSNSVSLSSFVPIRPKQDLLGAQGSTYLKSIVCSTPVKSSLAFNEHASGPQARTNPNLLNSLENLQRAKSNNAITVVQTGNKQASTEAAAAAAEVSESDRLKYIEIRRRKRKQDLSSLKNQTLNCTQTNQQELQSSTARSLNFKNFITNQFAEAAAAAAAKPADKINPQQGDGSAAYSFKQTHLPTRPNLLSKSSASPALPKLHLSNHLALFRKSIGNENNVSTGKTSNEYVSFLKAFSTSSDSNDSELNPPSFQSSPHTDYAKSTLVSYKEDEDDDVDELNQANHRMMATNFDYNEFDGEGDENDVVEIDSFDSNDKEYYFDEAQKTSQPAGRLDFRSQHLQQDLNDSSGIDEDIYNSRVAASSKKMSTHQFNDSDSSEDESSMQLSYMNNTGGKYTVNNIHSLRERQRRLRLKTLLMKLKIQLFECESDSKYELDNTISQMKLDEYCNTRNFNKKSLKSKQNILQEAVLLIKNLQSQQQTLERIRHESKLKLDRNTGYLKYLLANSIVKH